MVEIKGPGYAIADLPVEMQAEARKLDSNNNNRIDDKDDFANRPPESLTGTGRVLQRAVRDPLNPDNVPRSASLANRVRAANEESRISALSFDDLKGATVAEKADMLQTYVRGWFAFKDAKQQKIVDILTSTPEQLRPALIDAIDARGVRGAILSCTWNAENAAVRTFLQAYTPPPPPPPSQSIDPLLSNFQLRIANTTDGGFVANDELPHLLSGLTHVQMARLRSGDNMAEYAIRPEHVGVSGILHDIHAQTLRRDHGVVPVLEAVLQADPPVAQSPGFEASLHRLYSAIHGTLDGNYIANDEVPVLLNAARSVWRERLAAGDTRARERQIEMLVVRNIVQAIDNDELLADAAVRSQLVAYLESKHP